MTSKKGEELKKALLEEQTTKENINKRAIEILENGNPIKYITDVHQTIHIGDIETAKVLIASIGSQSVQNSDGIHPKGSGKSGKGKTHSFKAMLHLVPKKWKNVTTLSDKAIYYMNLEAGSIIFSDDVSLSEGLEGVIKRSTSNFQEGDTHTTIDANRKQLQLSIPPRISWWLTSVDDTQSSQLINRQMEVDVDESEEQDLKVLEFQKKQAEEGVSKFPENDDVEVCRAIIEDIKTHIHRVKIPFVRAIIWKYPKNRRNFDLFLDLIRSFATFRYKQRETDTDGFLIATIEDYKEAETLYLSRAKEQTSKLNKTEYKIVKEILKLGKCDANTLQKSVGISKSRLSEIMNGKTGKTGLLEKVDSLTVDDVTEKIGEQMYHKKVYALDGFDLFDNYDKPVYLDNSLLCISGKVANTGKQVQPIVKSEENAVANTENTGQPITKPKTNQDTETENKDTYHGSSEFVQSSQQKANTDIKDTDIDIIDSKDLSSLSSQEYVRWLDSYCEKMRKPDSKSELDYRTFQAVPEMRKVLKISQEAAIKIFNDYSRARGWV